MTDNLPEGWGEASLGELAIDIRNGISAKPADEPPGMPILRISAVRAGRVNIEDIRFHQDGGKAALPYLLQNRDLLLVRYNGNPKLTAVCGLVRGLDSPCVYPDKLIRLRVNEDRVLPEFIELAMGTEAVRAQLQAYIKSAAGQHGISGRDLQRVRLAVPPLPEQRRIVARVEAVLARTYRARAELERVERLVGQTRERLLACGFSGDLTSDWRSKATQVGDAQQLEAVQKQRQANTSMKRRQSPSAIPDHALPDGWNWMSPDELADDAPYAIGIGPFGSNLVRSDYTKSGVRLVFVRDIRRKFSSDSDVHYVSHDKAQELRQHQVTAGDVLITKMGDPPGDTAIYPVEAAPAIITADCIKLKPHPQLVLAEFLATCLRSPVVCEQIRNITLGVAHQKMSLDRFRSIALPIPPLLEQVEVVRRLSQAFMNLEKIVTEVTRALALLDRIDAAILARAVRGELMPQNPSDEPAATLLARSAAAHHPASPKRRRAA